MARRQAATKTAIPDDSSTPTAELRRKEAHSTSDSAIEAAIKEDTQNGSREDGVGTALDNMCIRAGDCTVGKQEACGSKGSCAKGILGKCVNFILSSGLT